MVDNNLQSSIDIPPPSGGAVGVEEKALGDIYTMPSVYMQAPDQPVKKINPKLWLWVSVGAVVLAGIVAASYFIFFSSKEPQPEVVVNAPIVNEEATPEPEPEPEPTPTVSPADRDIQRYGDVKNIQAALELYYLNKGVYPLAVTDIVIGATAATTLSSNGFSDFPLAPVYLKQVPQDPLSSGSQTYLYKYSSADGTAYKLTFVLESGVANLNVGPHYLTAQGFDTITAPVVEENPSNTIVNPSLDSDADGLTDMEEQVYGTDINKSDTDSDGYNDGSEVKQGYNPVLAGGSKLEGSTLVTRYINNQFGYSILHPATWQVQNLDEQASELVFSGSSGEFVQVNVQDNPEQKTALEWYQEFSPELASKVSEVTLTVGNAIKSPDGLNVYLSYNGKLITISYNNGTNDTADYLTTFELMYLSFRQL